MARKGDGHRPQQGGGPSSHGSGHGRPRGNRGRGGRPQSSGQQGGGGRGQGKRGRKRRKPSRGGAGFWGDPAKLPASTPDVRITDDPAAVPRSLGPPPLPGHEQIAVHYFTAVYDRAVATAGALAAAGGLIDPNALVGQDDD